jgi:hypothetical protein
MNKPGFRFVVAAIVGMGLSMQTAVVAQTESDAELAQELTNPIADIMTIPIQMNFDNDIGTNDEGSKITTNIQPVIPFEANKDWNVITRTIFPVISQDNIYPGSGSQFGLGDVLAQLFFSPRKPTSGGIIWGAGAVILLPTSTDSKLGGKKWGAGPAAVAITMRGPWTLGALGNHVWSFAGDSDRPDINNTFLQPFAAYTWPNAWTASVQSESNYNWKMEQWSIPVNVAASKLVFFGKLPVSLQAGVGYWLESPDTGPEGIRYRLQANIVLPR